MIAESTLNQKDPLNRFLGTLLWEIIYMQKHKTDVNFYKLSTRKIEGIWYEICQLIMKNYVPKIGNIW